MGPPGVGARAVPADARAVVGRIVALVPDLMFGSRLVLNIREDKGYTYSPFAALRTYREAGYFFTQADVRNAVTGAGKSFLASGWREPNTTSCLAERRPAASVRPTRPVPMMASFILPPSFAVYSKRPHPGHTGLDELPSHNSCASNG